MASVSRPSTPVNRITSVNISNPPPLEKYHATNDTEEHSGPFMSTGVEAAELSRPETPSDLLFTSPLDSPHDVSTQEHDDFNYAMYQNHPDETESIITWYIDELERNPTLIQSMTADELKRVFVKCQSALRHYRFQSALQKLQNDETEKRNAVETDLIKKQVDLLLQSPFPITPKRSSERPFNSTSIHVQRGMTPRTTTAKPHGHITKPKLKLVERLHKPNAPGDRARVTKNDFADHIKVFTLEKK